MLQIVEVEVVLWTGSRIGWSVRSAGRLVLYDQLPRHRSTQTKASWLVLCEGHVDADPSLMTYHKAGQKCMVRSHLEQWYATHLRMT